LKNPQACANISASADLKLGCILGGTAIFKQGGIEVGKQELKAAASIESGVSGSLTYCIGKGITGQVCSKSVTVKAGIGLKLGSLDLGSLDIKKDLTPKFCYPSAPQAAVFAGIAKDADEKINGALRQLQASVPGARTSTTTTNTVDKS